MNPLRHDFIRTCLASAQSASASSEGAATSESENSPERQFTYLDIGCGGGIFASSAARLVNTSSVTAIDPTPDVIRVAEEHKRGDPLLSQTGRLSYVNCAIEELDTHPEHKPEDGFDFVSVFEVIEHIDKPAAFLRQAVEHLKPGGWLIGSTIARHSVSYLTTKVVAEAPWPIGVVPPGTHDWDKYINPSELRAWFAKENRAAQHRGEKEIYGPIKIEGCIYLPAVGWKFIKGSEDVGNYFFGVQKLR